MRAHASMVAVSQAPPATIEPFDYQVSFTPQALRSGAVVYNYRETDEQFSDRGGS